MIWSSVGITAAAVLMFSSSVRAQSIPATATTETQARSTLWRKDAAQCPGGVARTSPSGYQYATPLAACLAHTAAEAAWHAQRFVGSCGNQFVTGEVTGYSSGGSCIGSYKDGAQAPVTGRIGLGTVSSGLGCPSGWTDNGSICTRTTYTCPTGYNVVGAMCEPIVCPGVQILDGNTCRCPAAGNAGDAQIAGIEYLKFTGNTPASPWCEGGCQVIPGQVVCSTGAGVRTCWATGNRGNGQTCASGTPGVDPAPIPADQPIIDCVQSGRTWGTVNGVGTCLAIGTPGQTGSATGPNSSTTTTNPDGTTTTKESRTERQCANGVCVDVTTTTTTTRNAQGQTTGTTTETTRTELPLGTRGPPGAGSGSGSGSGDGQGPEEDPSIFGGSCGGGFSCSGDAIQCAIASEQHRRNCETLGARTNATQAATDAAVNDAVAGTGTGENFLPRTTVDMSSINTGERINAGTCPAPVAVATPLGSFSVDLTNLCAPLSWFGLIILAASLLVAGRITFGGL